MQNSTEEAPNFASDNLQPSSLAAMITCSSQSLRASFDWAS